MLYQEYELCKKRLSRAKEIYEKVLEEQEEIFTHTQPNAIRYDKDKVKSSVSGDGNEKYIIEKERRMIDERLQDAKVLIEERTKILLDKESELRQSTEIIDIIYVYKFLDNIRTKDICDYLNYSKSQVYRIISQIECKM